MIYIYIYIKIKKELVVNNLIEFFCKRKFDISFTKVFKMLSVILLCLYDSLIWKKVKKVECCINLLKKNQ